MIYYITFGVSGFLIFLSEFFSKKSLKVFEFFFAAVGILVLAILGGIRSFSVGTDTLKYNEYFLLASSYTTFSSYFNSLNQVFGLEWGYSLLNYLVSFISSNPHFLYFVCQIIILTNVYFSLRNIRKNISVFFGWETYCFIYYTLSFNILRQSLALSFVLLGISYIFKQNDIKSLICILIAVLFHVSSIIALFIWFVGRLFHNSKNKKQLLFLSLLSILLMFLLPKVISVLSASGSLDQKYDQYIVSNTTISVMSTILIRLPMILLIVFEVVVSSKTIGRNNLYIYTLMFLEFCLLPLQSMGTTVGRLLLYFGISKVLGYPIILRELDIKSNFIKYVFYFIFFLFLMVVFYYQVIINNNNQVYPYVLN